MIECLILGDSIAVGTAQARPECVSYATSGINTTQFNKKYPLVVEWWVTKNMVTCPTPLKRKDNFKPDPKLFQYTVFPCIRAVICKCVWCFSNCLSYVFAWI